ncbi:hypothetical protein BJ944DRAFT_243494 [Cunninghamella echinulata]|nr:hypothetical protein BJ944DRAFT_243494 [Cunninghamella echinulata]
MSNCQTPAPTNRYSYSLANVNNKLYIAGGSTEKSDVWHIDLSQGINALCPTWKLDADSSTISNSTTGPFIYGSGFALNNGQSFYFQAGDTNFRELMNAPREFNTITNRFNPLLPDVGINSRSQATYTVDSSNKVWIYGGRTSFNLSTVGIKPSKAFNQFLTYEFVNTNLIKVKDSIPVRSPYGERPGRFGHTASLVNGKIFYLGGYTLIGGSPTIFEFDSAQIFDIQSQQSISMATIGDIPSSKASFSAVPAQDGQSIIIFGGMNSDEQRTVSNDVYILDTCTLTWRKQSTNEATKPRAGHQAYMYGKYMITMLGLSSFTTSVFENTIAILDTDSWTWVSSIEPGYTPSDPNTNPSCQFNLPEMPSADQPKGDAPKSYDLTVISNPNQPKGLSTEQKQGIGIGIPLLFLVGIGLAIFFYIRRNRRKNRQLNPRWMPGALSNNGNSDNTTATTYPPSHLRGTSNTPSSEYPLSTYNNNNNNNSNISPMGNQPSGLKTYTASDLDQWERQLIQDKDHPQSNDRVQARHEDIWNKLRGDLGTPDVERR